MLREEGQNYMQIGMCYDHKIDKKVILPNTTRKFILKVIWLPWFNNDAIIKSKKSKKKNC